MKIKFLADENLRRAIIVGLRRRDPSVSFKRAFDAGIAGHDDLVVLQIAASEGRMLVSHDVRTMPRYFHESLLHQESPGLVLIPQRLALTVAIEDLLLLWAASDQADWVNQICYLPL